MSREILKDIISYLPGRLVPAIVAIISTPVLANLLPLDAYGQYSLVLSTLLIITSFSVSWLTSVCLRFSDIYETRSLHEYLKQVVVICALLGCGLWLVTAYFLVFPFDQLLFMSAGLIWIIAQTYYEYFIGWLRARHLPIAYGIVLSWRSIAGFSISLYIIWIGNFNVAWLILALAISMLIGLPFLNRTAVNGLILNAKAESKKINKSEIIKYGIPAALINLITTSLSFSDRYFIEANQGTDIVAVYSASYDVAEKTVFFLNSMLLLSSSAIGFKLFDKEGAIKASLFLTNLMRVYLIIVPLLVAILIIISPILFTIILPKEYQAGADIFPIIAVSGLFVGVMHRYSLLLSFYKRTDLILICGTGALCIKLFFCWLLIPKYGMEGAAISTLLAYVMWFLFVRFAATRYSAPVFPWKTFRSVAGGVLMIFSTQAVFHFFGLKGSISYVLFSALLSVIFFVFILGILGEIKIFKLIAKYK